MAQPFLGEIKMFAGNFAPAGFALCDGQLLSVNQNGALFSLFGTIYGGDGRTTFGLPDLRGRLPIHAGSGPGLTPRNIGARSGGETATVSGNQLPPHTHVWNAAANAAEDQSPAGRAPAASTGTDLYGSATPVRPMDADGTTDTGPGQSHANVMPFLCVHFIVALFGIFP